MSQLTGKNLLTFQKLPSKKQTTYKEADKIKFWFSECVCQATTLPPPGVFGSPCDSLISLFLYITSGF
ncbi:hypothetical protein OUZ56_000158 [Daphnia magna]|uniref:Uncharacterized protein n=1 Tax=Daphnia magna TaxID=35525 RepID=A0ABQ9ZZK9_9CRUS|nr:hypothetical protein OUZ56_000158 [Daphnia magna]